MCGIAGIVRRKVDHPVAERRIRVMCDAIRHRGPTTRVYVTGRVRLGVRRLSIIDLAGGHQPIFNEERSKLIVFNGEVYNYRDLRRDLLAKGHEFRS